MRGEHKVISIKYILILIVFLIHGCSWNPFITENELNTVTVVKHYPYQKYYRAYFERKDLHKFPNGKKYLYLFNRKKHILGLLLHKDDNYLIYNLSEANKEALSLSVKKNIKYKSLLKACKKKGFSTVRSPRSVGYLIYVSLRQYKKAKTLRFNIKNYSKLQKRYKDAIKSYTYADIKHIKTTLPKRLIRHYYLYYKKQAKTQAEKKALIQIGSKLHLLTKNLTIVPKKSKKTSVKQKKSSLSEKKSIVKKVASISKSTEKTARSMEEGIVKEEDDFIEDEDCVEEEDFIEEDIVKEQEILTPSKPISSIQPKSKKKKKIENNITKKKTYIYYLKQATLNELNSYLSESSTINTLSYTQYNALTMRQKALSEQKLLTNGTLNELLLAYKLTKDEKYKERIMLIMKSKQEGNITIP